jgi:hypothetical protein
MLLGGIFNGRGFELDWHGYLPGLTGTGSKLPVLPFAGWVALTVLITPLAALLSVLLARGPLLRLRARREPLEPIWGLLTLTTLGLLVLTLVAIAYHDTYTLPLLPGLIVAVLLPLRHRRVPVWPAGVVIGIVAAFSLVSMREYHNWQTAMWQSGRALLAAGVAPRQVVGTLEWNHWYLWTDAMQEMQAQNWPYSQEVYRRLIIPDYVLSFTPEITEIPDLPELTPLPGYRVCARRAYDRPLYDTPGYIYTLTRTHCPAGLEAATPADGGSGDR